MNTQKGREIFEMCREELIIQSCELNQVMQDALSQANIPSLNRSSFFADLDHLSFDKLQRKYIIGLKQYIRYYAGRVKKGILKTFHVIH